MGSVEESCKGLCSIGKYGNVSGKSIEADACPNTCPTGKVGVNDTNGVARSTETVACVCESLTCDNLCPAGRFGTGALPVQANGCPGCPSGKYSFAYDKKETGKCSTEVQSLAECSLAAAAVGYTSKTAA